MRYAIAVILWSVLAYGQAWTGVLSSSRAIDWSNAGLPATLPDGETTANQWTPPVRTQCVTSQCNTVSGGTVTAASISAAITSAPNGTYVLIPAGTFALGGNVTITRSYVTVRGSGAQATKLTGGGFILQQHTWAGGSFLTAAPAKGATSVTVAAPPTSGRLASIEQCADGYSAANATFTDFSNGSTNCAGSYSDPGGPWVCGLSSACDASGGSHVNHRYQAQIMWIPSGNISGNTVTLPEPLYNANWSLSRSVAMTWMTTTGVAGVGIEDLTVSGTASNGVTMEGTYACWAKGLRLITTCSNCTVMTFGFDSHSLAMNNYLASTTGGASEYLVTWGSDSGGDEQSSHLFLNNILEGGFAGGLGDQNGEVVAYNYFRTANNNSWVENGWFNHHAGTSFLLYEGNQLGRALDDNTWGTHNFNTYFRNYSSCTDPIYPTLDSAPAIGIQGYARFENAIGNALGGGPCSSNGYQAQYGVFDVNSTNLDTTGLTQASTMRWGNYVSCSGNSHCNTSSFDSAEVPSNLSAWPNSVVYQNPVPANNNLPASFFMNSMGTHPNGGTGLSYWKACTSWTTFPTTCASYTIPPMPPIGPDVTGGQNLSGHAYNIPAALVWAALPADTNYTTSWGTNLKQFDERAFATDPAGAAVTVSPSSLTFSNQTVGTTSNSQAVTLTNTGTIDILVNSIAASGDFGQTNNCPIPPIKLTQGVACTINVTFTPTTTGTRTGTLTMNDDAGIQTVSLTGTGIAPAPIATFAPSSINFGNQIVGTTSPQQTITLQNTGNANLNVTSMVATGDYFVSTTCPVTPFSLIPTASCGINIAFAPSVTGTRSGSVTVTDNASDSPQTVPLTGNGVAGFMIKGVTIQTGATLAQ